MKCTYCNSDTDYKTRQSNGKRCGSCQHPFAFEPKTDPFGVADTLFKKAIDDCSAKDTHFFTVGQLFFELNRLVIKKVGGKVSPLGCFLAVLCVLVGFILSAFIHLFGVIIGFVAGIIVVNVFKKQDSKKPHASEVKISYETFQDKYLNIWLSVHGPIAKMLPPVAQQLAASAAPLPDVGDFSFDRALIVDRDEIAAMLVANKFHFENNCAILSFDRHYPEPTRFQIVREMLNRNPQLDIFALHDATPTGMQMPSQLRRPDWFSTRTMRVFDVGLRPRDAQAMNLIITKVASAPMPPEASALPLAPEEFAWLQQGNRVELAALRPAQIMRAVYRSFNAAPARPENDTSYYYDDGGIGFIYIDSGPSSYWYGSPGGDADGGSVGGADSFG